MNAKDMDRVAIEERLATLATEITEAQNALDRLVDADGTKPQAYILSEGRLRLLKAEEARLSAALPEAIQAELDRAEAEADAAVKAAHAAHAERKAAIVAWLSANGFQGASGYDLARVADLHGDVVALRGELMRADQVATRAARLADAWWSERRPLERRERTA